MMPGSTNQFDVLLFDLGGVLVEFAGAEGLQGLLRTPLTLAEIRARLVASPLLRTFETGGLEPPVFAEEFAREWNLNVSPAEFIAEFRTWTRGFLPGAQELLMALRPRYRLAALSNSNRLHWERNTDDLGITGMFDEALSSHQLGLHKPDQAIYREALARLSVSADRVAFFDDLPQNVDAARREGIAAFHVRGIDDLTRCLRAQDF